MLEWFNANLHSPACLEEPENRRALSWFKATARRPIEHMWRLAAILREHGLQVEMLTASDPGNILYEDGFQVVAKPHRRGVVPDDTPPPRMGPPRERRRR